MIVMADYKTKSEKIKVPPLGAPAGSSEAPEAPLVYKATIPPPLSELPLNLVDNSTGEVIDVTEEGQLKQALTYKLMLRYQRQTSARVTLYGFHESTRVKANGHKQHHQTCYCNYVPYSKDIDVLKNPTTQRYNLSGLSTCGSAAVCPICESIISERRANELRSAFNQAKAMGLHIQLLTFTIPHTIGDSIRDLRPKISQAQQLFFKGSPWKRQVDKYGIKAYARSLECRYGSHGWHPHFHFIVFSEKPLPRTKLADQTAKSKRWRKLHLSDQSDDWLWWLNRWQTMCEKSGLGSPNEYGLDIRDGSMAYDYIVKYGMDGSPAVTSKGKQLTWDMADEITKGQKKDGKTSFSPFQLLDFIGSSDVPDQEKKKYRFEFLEYARAMKGVPLMRWSKSAFDVFAFDDKTDAELLKDENDVSVLFAQISVFQWRCILKHSSRDAFMEIVNSGASPEGIHGWISQWEEIERTDRESIPDIDTPVCESEIIATGISQSEQTQIELEFVEFASKGSTDSALSDDDITRSLVSRKAKWFDAKISPDCDSVDYMSNGKTLRHKQRQKQLDSDFDLATDLQKALSTQLEENRAMTTLVKLHSRDNPKT